MQRITSFSVDHDFIGEGMYISRIDGDIVTYDLRTRKPNMGDYMDNITMHSVEHMFATYVRNSEIGDKVIYFGPMGCRTGFYLLVRDVDPTEVARIVRGTLIKIAEHDGEMFGNTRKECGNYKELSVEAAKVEARRYLEFIPEGKSDFSYPNS